MQPSILKLVDEVRERSERIATNRAAVDRARAEIAEDEGRIAEIMRAIKASSKEFAIGENIPPGYKTSWPNITKAIFVIRENEAAMSVREIGERIAEIELIEDVRKFIGTLSSALSTDAANKRRVYRHVEYDGGDWLYGPLDWYDEDDNYIGPQNNHPHG